MKLKLLSFIDYVGLPYEWKFNGLLLQDRNLVVGKNASGKSRILSSINDLASLLTKRVQLSASAGAMSWEADFADEKGITYKYELKINQSAVLSEKFSRDGLTLLNRPADGVATIQTKQPGTDATQPMDFKIPNHELAAVNKMDLIQTPFLEPLLKWGDEVFYYRFGTTMGQDRYGMATPGQVNFDPLKHDENSVMPKWILGHQKYPDAFPNALKDDMRRLGYEVERVNLEKTTLLNAPEGMMTLTVKEKGLARPTEQHFMSQGMFRAYSILVHANYFALVRECGCLLIDDIGEGLDFERSCILIDLLSEKARAGKFQLVMSTNDRFIMNHVPLKDWTIVKRESGQSRIYNYENSKKHFDEFKFTGLNNFDFLAMDFLNEDIDLDDTEGSPNEENGNLCRGGN